MKYDLFYYQKNIDIAVDNALLTRRLKSVLVQLPTRGGKSGIIISQAEKRKKNGFRTWVIVHRDLLVREFIESFAYNGHDVGVVHPEYPIATGSKIMVCSIKTLLKKMDVLPILSEHDLIVLDETHHAPASTWKDLLDHQPNAQRLGTTACTERLDNQGLNGVYDDIICGPQISELQTFGRLAICNLVLAEEIKKDYPEIFKPGLGIDFQNPLVKKIISTYDGIIGDPVKTYNKICPGSPALVFTQNKKQAEKWKNKFNKAGYNFVALYSGMSSGLIYDKISQFNAMGEDGREIINGIVGVDIFVEGLTVQHCRAIIHLRPTESLNTYMQMNGRGMMTTENKKSVWIIDHVANCLRHGLPDQDRTWGIDGEIKEPIPSTWECFCGTLNPGTAKFCRSCGEERALNGKRRKQKDLEIIPAEMGHVGNAQRDSIIEEVRRAKTFIEFQEIAEKYGYSYDWAYQKYLDYLRNLREDIINLSPNEVTMKYGFNLLDVMLKKDELSKA